MDWECWLSALREHFQSSCCQWHKRRGRPDLPGSTHRAGPSSFMHLLGLLFRWKLDPSQQNYLWSSVQMVLEMKLMRGIKFCSWQKCAMPEMPAMRVKRVIMCLIINTDVDGITFQCYYLCVLWEGDCIRGVKGTCYSVAGGKQTACSYIRLNRSLEIHKVI